MNQNHRLSRWFVLFNKLFMEVLEKFEIQKVFAKLLDLDVKPTRIACTYDVEPLG